MAQQRTSLPGRLRYRAADVLIVARTIVGDRAAVRREHGRAIELLHADRIAADRIRPPPDVSARQNIILFYRFISDPSVVYGDDENADDSFWLGTFPHPPFLPMCRSRACQTYRQRPEH